MRLDETMPMGMIAGEIAALARPVRRRGSGRFGDLDLVMPLAHGGMGGVYLAAHAATGERVALKILDPRFSGSPEVVARLCAEHTLASRARHPGVVEIREARRTEEGVPYLVMEYLHGETLGAMADRGPLELTLIIAIAAQIAAALAAVHGAGVIHCDVKPDNVFVLDEQVAGWPRVKVIDFGVSRTVDEAPAAGAAIAGTPWCMAPEQWSGAPVLATDVYALGCLLFDLTTGAPPFEGSLPALMAAHLEQRPARPSWLRPMPLALERLILRALAKDPAARPPMHELAAELAALHDAALDPALPALPALRRCG